MLARHFATPILSIAPLGAIQSGLPELALRAKHRYSLISACLQPVIVARSTVLSVVNLRCV
jgi:hypothetical protein